MSNIEKLLQSQDSLRLARRVSAALVTTNAAIDVKIISVVCINSSLTIYFDENPSVKDFLIFFKFGWRRQRKRIFKIDV
jgi:hypothetical protein